MSVSSLTINCAVFYHYTCDSFSLKTSMLQSASIPSYLRVHCQKKSFIFSLGFIILGVPDDLQMNNDSGSSRQLEQFLTYQGVSMMGGSTPRDHPESIHPRLGGTVQRHQR